MTNKVINHCIENLKLIKEVQKLSDEEYREIFGVSKAEGIQNIIESVIIDLGGHID